MSAQPAFRVGQEVDCLDSDGTLLTQPAVAEVHWEARLQEHVYVIQHPIHGDRMWPERCLRPSSWEPAF